MLSFNITLSNRFFIHCLLSCSMCFVHHKTVLNTNWMRLVIVLLTIGLCLLSKFHLRLKIELLSLLRSSGENFRPLVEAKCHAVLKMIVLLYEGYTSCSHTSEVRSGQESMVILIGVVVSQCFQTLV